MGSMDTVVILKETDLRRFLQFMSDMRDAYGESLYNEMALSFDDIDGGVKVKIGGGVWTTKFGEIRQLR
jgi:membrane protein implicated in regulation of membrane protease activity